MSIKLLEDLEFWKESEIKTKNIFKEMWYEVEETEQLAIHDFVFKKNWVRLNVELKTRRCKKNTYDDTLIGANKMWEAWNKFYSKWEETIFLFQYEDWLFFINPFDHTPRREYMLQRWDRGIDKKKGWIYFKCDDLIEVIT